MRLLCLQILLFAFFSGIVVTPDSARAGWPWNKRDASGLKKYSPQWWHYTSSLPVGSRQYSKHGKLWPPRPRPTDQQQTFTQQFHAAHFWPHPYNEQDRRSIEAFDAAQVNQGWKTQTTLYGYYFDPETQELTRSGREHVLWIIQSQGLMRNQNRVFVQISTENHINSMRVASVNSYLEELSSYVDQPLSVVLDLTSPISRPAREVELYQKAWLDTMIPPHIDYSVDGDGG